MLRILLRKMLNNRWMVLCLLLGSILVVAMVSSIPVYTRGVLQRMLTRDLEDYQRTAEGNTQKVEFPGAYHMKAAFHYVFEGTNRSKAYEIFDERIRRYAGDINLPLLSQCFSLTFGNLAGFPALSR